MTYKFEPFKISLHKRNKPKFGFHFHVDTSNYCSASYGLFICINVCIVWNVNILLTPFGSVEW